MQLAILAFKVLARIISPRFLLFNLDGVSAHIWFIRALIYVLLLFYFIKKMSLEKYVLISIPVMCIIDLCLCKYSLVLFNMYVPLSIYEPFNKFIGVAYVYFMIGYFVRVGIEKGKIFEVQKNKYLLLSILRITFNLIEFSILEHYKVNVIACNYIGTIISIISIFLFLVVTPRLLKDSF